MGLGIDASRSRNDRSRVEDGSPRRAAVVSIKDTQCFDFVDKSTISRNRVIIIYTKVSEFMYYS